MYPLRLRAPLVALLLACAAPAALAQPALPPAPTRAPLRLADALYLKPRLGAAAYGGDRSSFGNSLGAPGPATGLEVGYRRPVLFFNGGVGAYLLLGRYPGVTRSVNGAPDVATGELNKWRHTLGLTGYVDLMPRARVTPYLQLGAGTTAGVVDDKLRFAFSPLGGAGLDVAVTDQVGVFFETTAIYSFSDSRLDRARALGGGKGDWFGFLGGGLRIGLNAPFAAVDVLSVNGPTWLTAGDEAAFEVVTKSGATPPVTYAWEFGDGAVAAGPAVTHQFSTPGNYTLAVTATNGGRSDVQFLSVTVAAPEPVVAQATPAPPAPGPLAGEAPVEAPTCAQIVELNSVVFEQNSTLLLPESRAALEENLDVMRACPELAVRLEVYTSPDESHAATLRLRRAQAVRAFYAENGIAAARLVGVSAGPVPERLGRKEKLTRLQRVDTLPAPGGVPVAEQSTRPDGRQ